MLLSIFVHTPNQTFNSLERFQKWHLTGRPAPPLFSLSHFTHSGSTRNRTLGKGRKPLQFIGSKLYLQHSHSATGATVGNLEPWSSRGTCYCFLWKLQTGWTTKATKNNLQSLVWRCHSHCAHSFGHTLSKFFIAFDFFGHVQKNGPINQNYATQFPKN